MKPAEKTRGNSRRRQRIKKALLCMERFSALETFMFDFLVIVVDEEHVFGQQLHVPDNGG